MPDEYIALPLFPVSKRCKQCGVDKPLELFYRQRLGALGRQARCKACKSAEVAQKRRENYEQALANERRWRRNNPRRFIEATQRWYAKNRDHALRVSRAYYYANRERIIARDRAYKAERRELLRAKSRERYARNKEHCLAIARAYRERNLEKVRERDRNSPARFAASHRRRVLIRNAKQKVTKQEWELILDRYGRKCLCCGRSQNEVALHMDHVVPLSRGGSHTADNVQPLCKSCNSKKHTRVIDFRG